MSVVIRPILEPDYKTPATRRERAPVPDHVWGRLLASGRVVIGGGILALIVIACLAALPFTLKDKSANGEKNPFYYDQQNSELTRKSPQLLPISNWFGSDTLGRSLLSRCLLGGTISLGIGVAAASISVVLGVSVGLLAGYRGGWIDALLMRAVDVLYGLPYILLVILFKIALERPLTRLVTFFQFGESHWFSATMAANLIVLFFEIGLVSWLTMARV